MQICYKKEKGVWMYPLSVYVTNWSIDTIIGRNSDARWELAPVELSKDSQGLGARSWEREIPTSAWMCIPGKSRVEVSCGLQGKRPSQAQASELFSPAGNAVSGSCGTFRGGALLEGTITGVGLVVW